MEKNEANLQQQRKLSHSVELRKQCNEKESLEVCFGKIAISTVIRVAAVTEAIYYVHMPRTKSNPDQNFGFKTTFKSLKAYDCNPN